MSEAGDAYNKEIDNRIKNLPRTVFERLKDLRENYGEEIPLEIAPSNIRGSKELKVMKGVWFTPVVFNLEVGVKLGEITDPQVKKIITAFTKHCTSEKFLNRNHPRATKKDIKRANHAIDLYLQHCKTKPAM